MKKIGNTYKCACGCGQSFEKKWPRQSMRAECAAQRKKDRDRSYRHKNKNKNKNKKAITETPPLPTQREMELAVQQAILEKRQRFVEIAMQKYRERMNIDSELRAEAFRLQAEELLFMEEFDPFHLLELLSVHVEAPSSGGATADVFGAMPKKARVPANGSAN